MHMIPRPWNRAKLRRIDLLDVVDVQAPPSGLKQLQRVEEQAGERKGIELVNNVDQRDEVVPGPGLGLLRQGAQVEVMKIETPQASSYRVARSDRKQSIFPIHAAVGDPLA